ncbi:MAG: response regulator [Treponema sp.]|jgi:PAS domain S-box-containing protein|nr:response regulator [Treponema sp.]
MIFAGQKEKSRIAARAFNINIKLLLLVLVLLMTMSAVIITGINNQNAENLVRSYSAEAAQMFYSYISEDLILARKVANSKAITGWYTDERNDEKKTAVFNEVIDYTGILHGVHLYFGIHESKNEYSIHSDVMLDNFVPVGTLEPFDPDDAWYFEGMESKNDYIITIAIDDSGQNWYLWINHKVIADGELIGFFCAGLRIPDIFQKIFDKYEPDMISGYVIDKNGIIQTDSSAYDTLSEKVTRDIIDESSDPAFTAAIASYLGRIDGLFTNLSQSEIIKLRRGAYKYAAINPIDKTDWSIVILFKGFAYSSLINLMILLFVMLIILLLYVVGRNILMNRLFFTPLYRLTKSVSEGKSAQDNFYGSERDDEIGDLARTICDTTKEQFRQKQLLHAVNSAMSALFAAADDKNMHASFMKGMEIIGRCMDVDRIIVWHNELVDGVLCYVNKIHWESEFGKQQEFVSGTCSYVDNPEWEKKFQQNKYVNGPLSGLTEKEQKLLANQSIKSILAIPLFMHGFFYGFFSFDDCRRERYFTEEEIEILRSAGLMIVSALNRSIQAGELRKAHEYSKLMLDATPLGCHIWNKNHENIGCNEELVKLFGLRDKREYIDKFLDFLPKYQPDGNVSRDMIVPYINKALEEGKFVFEWMYQDQNGNPMPAEVTLVRVPYEDDFIVAGYVHDLREHKKMIDEIERRNNLLNVVNRTASVILATKENESYETSLLKGMELIGRSIDVDRVQIWQNDFKDGELHAFLKYQWISEAGSRMAPISVGFNFSYSEIPEWETDFKQGKYVSGPLTGLLKKEQDFLGGYDIKSTVKIPLFLDYRFWGFFSLDDCVRERTFTADEIDILHSGSLIMVSAITHNKQALDIRDAADMLEAVIASYSGIIWCVDRDNVITLFNGRYLEEIGCKHEDFKGKKTEDALHDNRFFCILKSIPETLNNGSQDFNAELDGKTYRIRTTLLYENGSITNVMGSFDDVTERTKLQVELKAALKTAQEANDAKSNFLARMSHEMRTPLNAVIGLSDLTLEAGLLNGEAHMNLEKINNAGNIILSTVNDILDISKIEAGKFELAPVEYDIPSLINDTITQSIMRIESKPIDFVLDINENLPVRLYGDDLRIKQILNNLLSNAFKYTREGKVTLSLNCERKEDIVFMTVKVSDTGEGIHSENIENLFSDYVQADMQHHRKIEGTGLGLPITKRLVEMMNGKIFVESEYGKGSVFTAVIQQQFVSDAVIGAETVESLRSFHYSDHKRRRNLQMRRISLPYARVLVVDDVTTNLDVAKGMMRPYGMQIDCLRSGKEAVDAVREEKIKYNAIFMDHMMPEMDGIEAAEIIRKEIGTEYAKTVPIIALTANAIMGNEEMFLSRGFNAFLPKPIELPRLDAIIREFVRDKKQEMVISDAAPDALQGHDRRSGLERRHHSGIEISGIDVNKGLLRFGNDEESYLDVLRSYAVNTPALLDSIRDIKKEDIDKYGITVHGIKSASRGIGAEAAGCLAEALEGAAKANDFGFIKDNNAAFIKSTEKLIADLNHMINEKNEKNPRPKADTPDRQKLSELLDACLQYKMDGVDDAMAELEKYEYESGGSLVDWLRENVDKMNFTEITEKLSALEKEG